MQSLPLDYPITEAEILGLAAKYWQYYGIIQIVKPTGFCLQQFS